MLRTTIIGFLTLILSSVANCADINTPPSERVGKERSKFRWLPSIEANSSQGLAVPQNFLYCYWECGLSHHGMTGRHLLVTLSPGINAENVSLGAAVFGGFLLTGFSSRLTYSYARQSMQQFEQSGESYLGPEFGIDVLLVHFKLGYLWHLGSKGKSGVILFGAGILGF